MQQLVVCTSKNSKTLPLMGVTGKLKPKLNSSIKFCVERTFLSRCYQWRRAAHFWDAMHFLLRPPRPHRLQRLQRRRSYRSHWSCCFRPCQIMRDSCAVARLLPPSEVRMPTLPLSTCAPCASGDVRYLAARLLHLLRETGDEQGGGSWEGVRSR